MKIHIKYGMEIPDGPDDFTYEETEHDFTNVDDAIYFLGQMERLEEKRVAEVNNVIPEEPEEDAR